MIENEYKPTLFMFAGNNGSGKSTMRNIIGEKIGIDTSIDPVFGDCLYRFIDFFKRP